MADREYRAVRRVRAVRRHDPDADRRPLLITTRQPPATQNDLRPWPVVALARVLLPLVSATSWSHRALSKKNARIDPRPRPHGQRPRRNPAKSTRGSRVPWLALIAIGTVVVFAAGIVVYALGRDAELSPFRASVDNPDPSRNIAGVVAVDYQNQMHVEANQRVAYDQSPPFGGPHDGYWAACDGVVYESPIRSENFVHSLEHGAVWIAYDPQRVVGDALGQLRQRVEGQTYLALSPYPGLDRAVSVQSWERQLKLDDPADPRLEQFVRSLKQNPNTHPEVGASCDSLGPGAFDPEDPPPFDPTPPGPDAVPLQSGSAGRVPAPDSGGR